MENPVVYARQCTCQLLVWLLLLCPLLALGKPLDFDLHRLPISATADEVMRGQHDHLLEKQPGKLLHETTQEGRWWRVQAHQDIPAALSPRFVLENPHVYRLQVWLPGAEQPTVHSLFGNNADVRFSTRALVIDLPEGLQKGSSVWMLVQSQAGSPALASIAALEDVHKADIIHVAWRSSILAIITTLTLLSAAFWIGSGEHSHGFFSLTLLFALLYLTAMAGELRYIPWLPDDLIGSPKLQRILACLGVASCNMFQRLYLDLPRRMPHADRLLLGLTIWMLSLCIFVVAMPMPWISHAGNAGLIASAMTILVTSVMLAFQGIGPGQVVMVTWMPLIFAISIRALEMSGVWNPETTLTIHALDGSFALAALGMTLGLTLKLVELRRDRDKASALVSQDALTGALSRRAIEQAVTKATERVKHAPEQPLSVAFLDLDFFKQINDQFGHDVGDQYLRQLVIRLRNCLRRQDLLGRYGGDEFLLLMPSTPLEEAHAVASRLASMACSSPIIIGGKPIPVSLSIGVAQQAQGDSVSQLLRRADTALYASKSGGRGRVSSSQKHQPSQRPTEIV